jgi:hypothetical protein
LDTDSAGIASDVSEFGGGWSSIDWCGPVDDAGVNVRDGGGRRSGFGGGAGEWSVGESSGSGRELALGGDQ